MSLRKRGFHCLRLLIAVALCGCCGAILLLVDSTPSPNSQLCAAAARGDVRQVDRELARGTAVDCRDDVGETPLMLAAGGGKRDAVDHLLAGGADVNARSSVYGTALMCASCNGYANVVPTLLEHGAKVAITNNAGNDALWLAAAGGHEDVVALLLSAGADLDRAGAGGLTPRKMLAAAVK